MKKLLLIAIPAFCLAEIVNAQASIDMDALKAKMSSMQKSPSDSSKTASKKTTVAEKTKGTKKHEGLFTLYQDTSSGSVQIYIKKDQLDKEYIYHQCNG